MKRKFLALTVPNILTNLTIPLVSLVDLALMGHMKSSSYIITIGYGTVIFNFLYWALGFLRMGTTGFVAQAYGEGDEKEAFSVLLRGVVIALLASVLIILFKDLIFEFAIQLMQPNRTALEPLYAYFNIRIFAAPATITMYVITGWLLGMHNAKATLLLALIVNVCNSLLSYLFVWKWGWSIEGVAMGTLIAQYAGFVVGLIILKIRYRLTIKPADLRLALTKSSWVSFLKVNSDIFVRTLCLIFTLSFFKTNAANIDLLTGAANVLLLEFITISAYGIDGIAFSAESMSGLYFGAKQLEQFKKLLRIAFSWGLILASFISLVFWLGGEAILNVLTDKKEVIDVALNYLPWLIIAPLINAFAFIWDGIYIGCTASKEMRNTLLISTFIVFLPAYYLLKEMWANHGIWLALTLFMLSRGFIQSLLARKAIFKKFD